MKKRFSVHENEGAFFYETHLVDSKTNKMWSIDEVAKVPGEVVEAFLQQLRESDANMHEARFMYEFAMLWAKKGAPK